MIEKHNSRNELVLVLSLAIVLKENFTPGCLSILCAFTYTNIILHAPCLISSLLMYIFNCMLCFTQVSGYLSDETLAH